MRKTLLTSAAVLGLALTAPAFANTGGTEYIPPPHKLMREGVMNPRTGARYGHVPGIGQSVPFSTHASNIVPGDTHSQIAPNLVPKPPVGRNASMHAFLHSARRAIARGRTGEAQEALERAMTARLNRDQLRGIEPSSDPVVGQLETALNDLAFHRYAAVDRKIARAMTGTGVAENAPFGNTMGMGQPGAEYNTYGTAPAAGSQTPSANSPQTSGLHTPPTGAPHRTANVGTLGTEVSPPGSQMNPTGNPKY